jgi:archaeosortase A (PGF-CTERM-specific)
MLEYLVLVPCIFFIAFLIPGRYRVYFASLGWAGVVAILFAGIPEYIALNNFLYPLLAVLSIPFLFITVKYLIRGDERVIHLSRAAAVAFIIYAPFALIPAASDWLIGVVVGQTAWLIEACGYPITFDAWNIIGRNGFRTEIILACTGIQAIAIMLGVTAAVPTTLRQKVYGFLLVAPTIYILNLVRNTAVIIAYTEQWFPYYPEIAGNGQFGYESFFWAHNVAAELLALVLLIGIAYGLFRLIPDLGELAAGLYDLYRGEVIGWFRRSRD